MKGLEVIQRIAVKAASACRDLHPLGGNLEDAIFRVLKENVCEINQVVTIERRSIPVDEKEADKYVGYAKGAAFQKMAMEGLHQVCHEESEYDSMRDEETKTYRVFVIKP